MIIQEMTTVPPSIAPYEKGTAYGALSSPRSVTGPPGASYFIFQKPCSDRRQHLHFPPAHTTRRLSEGIFCQCLISSTHLIYGIEKYFRL